MAYTIREISRGTLIVSGAITVIFFTDYSDSIAKAYYLHYILVIVVIGWFMVENTYPTATAPRQKRTINLILAGLFGLYISSVVNPDYKLINKEYEIVDIENRTIQADYSEENVPQEEWDDLAKSAQERKVQDLSRARTELFLLRSQGTRNSDFSYALAIFSVILIVNSCLTYKRNKRMDLDEAQSTANEKLISGKTERQARGTAFREAFIQQEKQHKGIERSREEVMDDICRELDALKVPDDVRSVKKG